MGWGWRWEFEGIAWVGEGLGGRMEEELREMLKENVKGVGDTGANMFMRRVQGVSGWDGVGGLLMGRRGGRWRGERKYKQPSFFSRSDQSYPMRCYMLHSRTTCMNMRQINTKDNFEEKNHAEPR
jgi:hypothetical protein